MRVARREVLAAAVDKIAALLARRAAAPRLRTWCVGASLTAAVALGGWLAWPLPDDVTATAPAPALTLVDRYGVALRTTRSPDGSRGGWIRLAEMDPDLLRAFVALEDHRFFEHFGVDVRAVGRAIRDNLRARRVVSGASTITMQLARLVAPAPRTWAGKARQALWAVRLECHLTKHEILEQYLNRVPLGQGSVGVEGAAALYFGASARELSLGQAALLAGLARAPSRDNPLVAPGQARERRALALARLEHLGWIDQAEREPADREPVMNLGRQPHFLAPHFTSRVLQWTEGPGLPANGTWRTSLDISLQQAIEAEVRHSADVLARHGARHAAAVVLDNPTGEVLAWVGSPDFWADTAGQVDMVVSARQPGSALKPFLYGLAFDRGYSPASVLPDVERDYRTPNGPYHPRNYDRRFHGPVRIREALASSYNVPAVELTDRLGVASLLSTLSRAGFVSLTERADHYGLGLALGNGDVTLLELANGYRALANAGSWQPIRWRAGDGVTVASAGRAMSVRREDEHVMSARAAALVLDILADPAARIPGFGVETPFEFPFPVAVKTGTSRHYTDNWAVAVTGRFTVAVWVGNFSGRPMDAVSGVTGAGPLLHRTVLATATRYLPGSLPAPESTGAVPVRVCRLSGLGAGPSCPETVEYVPPGQEPKGTCDWHRADRVVIPPEYGPWLERHAASAVGGEHGGRATWVAGSALAGDEPRPVATKPQRFRIVAPLDGDQFDRLPDVPAAYSTLTFRAIGARVDEPVRWFVDGAALRGARWQLAPGTHTIRAVTPSGARDEVRISVRGKDGEGG